MSACLVGVWSLRYLPALCNAGRSSRAPSLAIFNLVLVMDTLLRIALTPDADAKATPLELLEDFADTTPGWHYLEDESRHYADEKGAPACILRRQHTEQLRYADLAFAAPDPDAPTHLELVLIDAANLEERLDADERQEAGRSFLRAMDQYLDRRPGHATLTIETETP